MHAPFSFGEGDAYGKDTASRGLVGPLAGFKGLRPTAGQGPNQKGGGRGGGYGSGGCCGSCGCGGGCICCVNGACGACGAW